MYSSFPTIVLGFHGCDEKTKKSILNTEDRLKPSKNEYDWLGHGIYFWAHNPKRALEYAEGIKKHPERYKTEIKKPAVIGALIDTGKCLNLLDSKFIKMLKKAFEAYKNICEKADADMAVNKSFEKGVPLKRHLDCAVVETLHSSMDESKQSPFNTVRGVFFEGGHLYEGAGFREKNHIQMCVRNPNCIKGYFDPLEKISGHPLP